MTEPVEEVFLPVGTPFDGTVGVMLAAGEGWSVAEVVMPDGRLGLMLDEGTLADLMPPGERDEFGARVLVFGSADERSAYAAENGWTVPSPRSKAGPTTLLGHLAATRSDVFIQAEVLCTLSLGWVLARSEAARRSFGRLVGVAEDLAWKAEDRESVLGGRPDLAGRLSEGGPTQAIVEAKLGAPLEEAQLRLFQRAGCGVAVLVPRARVPGSRRTLERWSLDLPVLSWDEVLSDLEVAVIGDQAASADVLSLTDLYRHVERTWIAPFTAADLQNPAGRQEDFVRLIDQIASKVTDRYGFKPLPLFRRPGVDSRRYVVIDELGTNPALRVFISTAGQLGSPIGLMVHRDSRQREQELVDRWLAAQLPVVQSDGHSYLPLHVPVDAAQDEMIEDCVAQALNAFGLLGDPVL